MKYDEDEYGFFDTTIGSNDLKTTHPKIFSMLTYVYIGYRCVFDPLQYLRKDMHIRAYFKCPTCNGEFIGYLDEMSENEEICPYCTNRRLLPGFNDITITDPLLAKEISQYNYFCFKNFNPKRIFKFSGESIYWDCPWCESSYLYSINKRVLGDRVCPYCGERYEVVAGINDLQTTNPSLAKLYSKNNKLKIYEVSKGMSFSAEWVCSKCGESFSKQVNLINEVTDCICYSCTIDKPSVTALAPELIKNEWCKEENELIELNPNHISTISNKRAFWQCKNKHRKYLYAVNKKYRKYMSNEETCPICLGKRIDNDKFS